MKIRSASAALFAVLAGSASLGPGAALAGPTAPAAPDAHLCRADETPVFACKAARSLASVCLGRASAHYRFGLPGSPSLDIASTGDWSNVHLGVVAGQGGGQQSHLRLTAGLIQYIVFAGVNGGLADNPGQTYAGIAVSHGKDGETPITQVACDDGFWTAPDWTGRIAAAAPPRARARIDETVDGPFDAWF